MLVTFDLFLLIDLGRMRRSAGSEIDILSPAAANTRARTHAGQASSDEIDAGITAMTCLEVSGTELAETVSWCTDLLRYAQDLCS